MHPNNTPNSIAAATGFIPARLVALDREAIEALAQAHLDAAHGLMGLLDRVDGKPDAEENGDEQDAAWIEWHTMRGSQKRGHNIAGHEDDEDDDPAEDDDPGGCEHDGREDEDEY